MPEYRPAGYRYVQGVFRSRLGYLDGTVAHVGHLLCHPLHLIAGTEVGTVTVTVEGQTVASYPVVTAAAVERMTFGRAFQRLGQGLLAMG